MATTHSPAQAWSFRVPSPPRILVPPPMLNANGTPDINVFQDQSFDFESSGFANAEFLEKVTYGNFAAEKHMLEWKYEERRMAQQILPFLYLGPMSAARDETFLQREHITMVLAVRNTMSAQAKLLGTKVAEQMGLETKMVDVAGNQELIAAFPRAIEAVNAHLSNMYHSEQASGKEGMESTQHHGNSTPGRVLIFCESGNERSAAVVTAYIMAMYAVDVVRAIQVVQAQRFAVAFDDSMRNLLSTYDTMLQAKRDVVQASAAVLDSTKGLGNSEFGEEGHNGIAKSSKRSLEDAYDDDMDVEEENDIERFDGRSGSAPFQDKC
ncbi:hypothetical protein ACLMJK_001877 [Lecanora helva]